MNSVRSNNLSLKYQMFTLSGCKAIGIIKFEFVAKTQFLSVSIQRFLPLIFQLRDILDAGDDKIGTKPREAIKIFSGFLYHLL